MSKITIITQQVDGYDVIAGISTPMIDAEQTRPLVNKYLATTDVAAKIDGIQKEIASHARAAAVAKEASKSAKYKGKDDEAANHAADYRFRWEKVKECQEQLKAPVAELVALRQKATEDLAVYHQPKPGEIIKANGDEIIAKLKSAIDNGCVLTTDLKEVIDNRGKTFFKKSGGKWIVQEITKLGEEPMSGSVEKLTESELAEMSEQAEENRVANLKTSDRETEKQMILDGIASQAVSMRSKLEIQGDKDALKKSQDWYKEQVAAVEKKYGA